MKVLVYRALHSPPQRIQQKLKTMLISLAGPSMVCRHISWERGRESELVHHHLGSHTQQRERACAQEEKARKLGRVPSPKSAEGTRVHSPHLGVLPRIHGQHSQV